MLNAIDVMCRNRNRDGTTNQKK